MRVLYYDCFCGISGDMNLGALLDLGVDETHLRTELEKLKINGEFELIIQKCIKSGISGTRVDVELKEHQHDNGHNHHEHRNLSDIREIIEDSELNDNVKRLAMKIFMKIAGAEAKVHGKSIDEIHFHEVGAVDSIVDITGAAICLDFLKVDKIMASTVHVGGGTVKCAHGIIPVPAPATVEILKNIPIKTGLVMKETTTPTGAAILAANVDEFTDKLDMTIKKTGYGIGHMDFEIPNVLRVYLGEKRDDMIKKNNYIYETNIDDMSPELLGYVEEKLFENGALDVFRTPIYMKKGRIAVKLTILAAEERERDVLDVIFRETTTIGVRKYRVDKLMLERDFKKINTKYGEVTIKNAYYKGEKIKYKPEYEECRKLAKDNNIPINEIYGEIYRIVEGDNND